MKKKPKEFYLRLAEYMSRELEEWLEQIPGPGGLDDETIKDMINFCLDVRSYAKTKAEE